jgi:hypothetical protein
MPIKPRFDCVHAPPARVCVLVKVCEGVCCFLLLALAVGAHANEFDRLHPQPTRGLARAPSRMSWGCGAGQACRIRHGPFSFVGTTHFLSSLCTHTLRVCLLNGRGLQSACSLVLPMLTCVHVACLASFRHACSCWLHMHDTHGAGSIVVGVAC